MSELEARLGSYRGLLSGDTDSERFFARVTRETDSHGGDVTAGLSAAARWVAQELPLFALNVVLATSEGSWALRYPRAMRSMRWRARPGAWAAGPTLTTPARPGLYAFAPPIFATGPPS